MSLFQWPFKRKQYAGLANPRFVSDIVAANEAVIDALIAVLGLSITDFAIVSGFAYSAGSPGTYGPGIFYLNGDFYYMGNSFSEGLYLTGITTDTMPQPFNDDGNSRNIYTLLQGQTTNSGTGASPVFSGSMNNYRLNLTILNAAISSVNTLLATLGNAAFRNVGVTSGTVAAGDDSRFGYTKDQANALFATLANVLLLTTPSGFTFTPTTDYQPATKKYVDQSLGFRLRWLGNISADSSIITKLAGDLDVSATRIATGRYTITHNMGTTNYFTNGIGYSNVAQLVSPRSVWDVEANTFSIALSDDDSYNDTPFQLTIFQYF